MSLWSKLKELAEGADSEASRMKDLRGEELRVAASLIHDLGVNPAGVEVVLHMRRRLLALEDLMGRSLRQLLEELEDR